jgi:hypothetical protein
LQWFIQRRVPNITFLLVPWLQCLCLMWAMICSFTRITDHRHHWWDVLAGFVLGAFMAVFTVSLSNHNLGNVERSFWNILWMSIHKNGVSSSFCLLFNWSTCINSIKICEIGWLGFDVVFFCVQLVSLCMYIHIFVAQVNTSYLTMTSFKEK